MRLKVNNKSGRVYTILATIRVNTTLYTGKIHKLVKKEVKDAKISPDSGNFSQSETFERLSCPLNLFFRTRTDHSCYLRGVREKFDRPKFI